MLSPYKAKNLSDLPAIRHGFFTNQGGVSTGQAFSSLNCSLSQDDTTKVKENRRRVAAHLAARHDFLYIPSLCHSSVAVFVDWATTNDSVPKADGVVTTSRSLALGVLGADCAPVLFADHVGGVIGACHAGWRGALGGIIENTTKCMVEHGADVSRIVAAVGPCIQQLWYEVGVEFEEQFLKADVKNERFFAVPKDGVKPHFDLPEYVVSRLQSVGIQQIENLGLCTRSNAQFFSYRRHTALGVTGFGCQASAIVLDKKSSVESLTPRSIQHEVEKKLLQ